MSRQWWMVLLLLLMVGSIVGCGGDAPMGPPEIVYGRDICSECGMIVSEPRFAAAYRDAEGVPFIFDDIADLLVHADRAGVTAEMTAWVHDYDTEEWVDAPAGWFVHSDDIVTPMGGGIVAFAERDDAERFISSRGGELLRWSDLLEGAVPVDHHDHDH